jgi:hypothetical protein
MTQTSFSGGEMRTGSGAVYGTEVWNRDPLPPPPPPKVYKYRLTVCTPGSETVSPSEIFATATLMEQLVEFELQTRALGYEFIKLERLGEE